MKKINLNKILFYSLLAVGFSSDVLAGKILDDIIAKKTIVIGYREATVPYSFKDLEGKVLGYSLDICHKIIERINKEKNTTLTVKYQIVFPQTWLTLIQNGTVNMVCAGTTVTPERLQKVKIAPINADTINPIVLAQNTTITKKEDLKGKNIIILPATAGERIIHHLNDKEKFGIKTIYVQSYTEALSLLEKRQGDAVIMTKLVLAGEIAKSNNPQAFKILDIPLSEFNLVGIMYSKDDPELETLIKSQMEEMKKDGSLFKLYDKWFTQSISFKGINLNLPLTEAQKKAIEAAQ